MSTTGSGTKFKTKDIRSFFKSPTSGSSSSPGSQSKTPDSTPIKTNGHGHGNPRVSPRKIVPSAATPKSSKRRIEEVSDEEFLPPAKRKPEVDKKEKKDKAEFESKKPQKPSNSKSTSKSDQRDKNKKDKPKRVYVIESSSDEDELPPARNKSSTSSSNSPSKSKKKKSKIEEEISDEDPLPPPPKKTSTSHTPSKSKNKKPVIEEEISDEDPFPPPPAKKKSTSNKPPSTPETSKSKKSKDKGPPRTPKLADDQANSSSTMTPEDKKRQQTSNYFKFKSRGGPKNLGSKDVPEGSPGCLKDMAFVITGVLDSFEKEDIVEIVSKYGGRVTTAVSGKTSFLLVGEEPGETKIKKAKQLKIPTLTEDEFLDKIRASNPNSQSSGPKFFGVSESDEEDEDIPATPIQEENKRKLVKKEPKVEISKDTSSTLRRSPRKGAATPEVSPKNDLVKKEKCTPTKDPIRKETPRKSSNKEPETVPSPNKSPSKVSKPSSSKILPSVQAPETLKLEKLEISKPPPIDEKMWVDKYKPSALKSIVGQAGEKSNANKLYRWLSTWFQFHGKSDEKVKASWPGLRDPDGKTFKAALLSGPPGIGKTTTAHLVCRELGYDYFELNASDTRNKRNLVEQLSDAVHSRAITGFITTATKRVIIMDEVDGMSGNEDRGGIQELIGIIKGSNFPIICICNDRNHQKIRSLANYCFDLRYNKPTNEQLKGFIQSICYKEKLKLPVESVQQLINSTDHDIRQILNQLELIKAGKTTDSSGSLFVPRKDLKFGPWDVCRKVFSASDHAGMSIMDKANLFFQDYSFGPLFIQENYAKWTPLKAKGDKYKTLDLVSKAAESIATGEIVENLIRRTNNWSLLPTQATFSSVLPGEFMEGREVTGIEFPQWLGKNSNRNKMSRLLQTLHNHVHLEVSGSLEALNMDYLPYLRKAIVNPLVQSDVEKAAGAMKDYDLLREDLDNILELTTWTGMKNPMDNVDTKTKSAFTRLVNKEIVPYSIIKVTKGRGGAKPAGGDDYGDEDEDELEANEEEEEDDVVEKDAMIKVRTKTKPKGAEEVKPSTSKSSKTKSATSNGRGKKK